MTSLRCFIGPEGDISTTVPRHAQRLDLENPILTMKELSALKIINMNRWKTKVRVWLVVRIVFRYLHKLVLMQSFAGEFRFVVCTVYAARPVRCALTDILPDCLAAVVARLQLCTCILGLRVNQNLGPIPTGKRANRSFCLWLSCPNVLQVIDITFDRRAGPDGLLPALMDVCDQAQAAVEQKYAFIVLSDR